MNAEAPIEQPRRRFWSSPWFKLALSAVMIVVLLWEADVRELSRVLSRADLGWVGLGLLVLIASHVVCVRRWEMLAHPLGLRGSYSDYFNAYFTGLFLNLFGPSTVAGDIARTLFLAGSGQRRSLAAVSVLAERALGLITLLWVAAIAILAQPQYPVPAPLWYGAWAVFPATILGWIWLPQLGVLIFPRSRRVRRLVEQDLVPYRKDWRLMSRANLASLAFHLLNIGSQVPLARALGLPTPAGFIFLFVPIVNMLSMVPVSFSGIGVREMGYWYFMAQAGVPRSSAVALGILSSATVLANGLVGGLVYLLWQHRKKASGEGGA